jgi:PAS domain S-box-containing protein
MKNIFILDKEIIMGFLNYLKKEENLFDKINYKKNIFRNFLFNRKKRVIKEDDSDFKKEDLRFRKIIELAPDGILLIDLTGKVTLVNDAFCTLTGQSSDKVIGKHITQLQSVRVSDIPIYLNQVKKIARGEELRGFEFRYINADGIEAWGEARGGLLSTGLFKKEIIAILRDITERKKNEEKILKINEELSRSNRELDDYTFAVSHDLKAPLRTIDSFSSFLLDDYLDKLDDTGKEYLIRMRSATQRMKTLIEDLLTMSRVGRKFTEFEFVNLNKLIGEIEDDHKTLILEKNSEIIISELPTIKTQRIWIKQVFSNLVSNGLKFNKSKNPKIWIKYEEKEDSHLFSVKDNGIGIEKRHEEKIFSLFQRLHTQEEYPGSGAGLTICKKIVESLGGKIWFESEIDKGSTFFFTLLKENIKPENIEDIQNINDQINGIHNFQE